MSAIKKRLLERVSRFKFLSFLSCLLIQLPTYFILEILLSLHRD